MLSRSEQNHFWKLVTFDICKLNVFTVARRAYVPLISYRSNSRDGEQKRVVGSILFCNTLLFLLFFVHSFFSSPLPLATTSAKCPRCEIRISLLQSTVFLWSPTLATLFWIICTTNQGADWISPRIFPCRCCGSSLWITVEAFGLLLATSGLVKYSLQMNVYHFVKV